MVDGKNTPSVKVAPHHYCSELNVSTTVCRIAFHFSGLVTNSKTSIKFYAPKSTCLRLTFNIPCIKIGPQNNSLIHSAETAGSITKMTSCRSEDTTLKRCYYVHDDRHCCSEQARVQLPSPEFEIFGNRLIPMAFFHHQKQLTTGHTSRNELRNELGRQQDRPHPP